MRVLIVSDTHKKHENLITIMEKERPFDRMIHLGDAEGYEDYIAELAGCPLDIVAGAYYPWTLLLCFCRSGGYQERGKGKRHGYCDVRTHPQTAYRKGSWCSGIESGQHIISSSGWTSAVLYRDGNRRKWYSGLSAQISF